MKNEVTIVQIAKEMKLSPKRARAVLRAKGYHRQGTRWTFPAEDRSKIKEVIRSARKRATITTPRAPRDTHVEPQAHTVAH